MQNELIQKISDAAKARGKSPRTLCRMAGVGGNFIDRLENGGRCWPETAAKVEAFIAAHPPQTATVEAAE